MPTRNHVTKALYKDNDDDIEITPTTMNIFPLHRLGWLLSKVSQNHCKTKGGITTQNPSCGLVKKGQIAKHVPLI